MADASLTSSCYRHPDRPTGIRCQRCSRTICHECMISAPVGFHCPVCVQEAAKNSRQLRLTVSGASYLAYAIIAVNCIVAAVGVITTPGWAGGELGKIGTNFGLLGGGLAFSGGRPALIGVDSGEWYRIFSGAFLHAGPIHLGFNMLILWQTASRLEPAFGRLRFALIYVVALLGGSLGALLVAPDALTVGASGAVFGLMGALFIAERQGFMAGPRSSIGFLIVANLFLGLFIPGISVGGHVGGLLAGLALGWLFQEFERRRLSSVLPVMTAIVLGAALFAASLWAATLWPDPLF